MRIHVLASSSSGNAIVVEIAEHVFLIDAGISCACLEQRLVCCGLRPSALSAVFITHEHQDHVKGLDAFIRRYRIPVFSRPATWEHFPRTDRLPSECVREITESLHLEGIQIDSFSVSHDAADPVGYAFHGEDKTFVVATDFGVVTSTVENAIREADYLVLESNHDPEMLRTGRYPAFLKKRIAGEKGHLSNEDAGRLLAESCLGKPRQVFLAHLSQENNQITLAENCVRQFLQSSGYQLGRDVTLHRTFPNRISSLKTS